MNIIDVLIILFILLYGVIGFKKGFIRSVVSVLGILLVFVLSYMLKDPIAEWLSLNLPFFNFSGAFKDVTILNVIIYQLIAFIIVFSILMGIYYLVLRLSSIIETILKYTIVLGIPSKILGFIFGLIEGVIVVSIALLVLNLPVFNLDFVRESKLRPVILENVPITGTMINKTSKAISEISDLAKDFTSDSTKDEFNRRSLDILLKYKVIKVDYAEKLVNSGKLKISNANSIINNYK